MRRTPWMAATLTAVAFLAGCAQEAELTRADLAPVIERDALHWEGAALPPEALSHLAAHKVVVLGETHHLREHWELVASLAAELQPEGFGQLLIEGPQMAEWLFDDYVTGGLLAPEWTPSPFYARRLDGLREVNAALPPDERIRLRAIDANEDWYGGAAAFRELVTSFVDHQSTPGPVADYLPADYGEASAQVQAEALTGLSAALEAERESLVAAWGAPVLGQVLEMIEVESASIGIRADRATDDDAAARAREDVIKRLADEGISACECGTLVNIGGHHAQKSPLMGTQQEWLGDHLAHRSPATGGSVYVVGVSAAEVVLEPGAEGTPFDVRASSPQDEVLRVVAETWPGQDVLLPMDDPMFRERTVAYNSEDTIYVTRLAEQFDAVLQYGLAHRMPID